MNKKWFKYTIDYEYGTAHVYSKDRLEKPLSIFYNLAGNCFGIRKSIGETKLLDEELINFDGELSTPKNTEKQIMAIGMGDYTNTMLHAMINKENHEDISQEKLDRIVYILAHSGGDLIAFSDTKDKEGDFWKIKSEWGDEWCTCKKEGKPELVCKVHHFYVANHDKKCRCNK